MGANVPKPLAGNDNPSARGRKRKRGSSVDENDDAHGNFKSYEEENEKGGGDSDDSD